MPLPRTAVGILGFVLFTGWLIALILPSGSTSLMDTTNTLTTASNSLANSANNVTRSDSWFGAQGSITGVFGIAYNLIIIILGLFLMIFSSVAAFTTIITSQFGMPPLFSGIFTALLLVGSIFALLSKIFENKEGKQ